MSETPTTATPARSKFGQRRRRFLMVSVAALAALAAALGVSFAGSTGTSTVTVSASSTNFVFPVAAGAPAPADASLTGLRYGSVIQHGSGDTFSATASDIKNPTWTPVAGSAGSVTTAGDVVLIDARSVTLGTHGSLIVNMYVTNLEELQQTYSSFAFPVNVYRCSASCAAPTSTTGSGTQGNWEQASTVLATGSVFLTNTEGFLTLSLEAGYYYDIAFNTGGSFYTVSTTSGSLSPTFYFTATPA
ncbi:MAG: hypothetical protein IRZ04_20220 [Rhodospirillales bacterium]|nr:hypothetical protein [Rhodospirillales bacterium]